MLRRSALFVFVTATSLAVGVKLPSEFQFCKRNNTVSNQCLKSAIQNVLPALEKGVPELDIPPLQPITIPSAVISEGKGPVAVVQKYRNIKMYDFMKVQINNVKTEFTPSSFKIDIDIFNPQYKFEADYDVDGRILLLPIRGRGRSSFDTLNATMSIHVSASTFDKVGTIYAKLDELKLVLYPGKIVFHIKGIFGGNERLESSFNDVLNENWKDVSEDVKPGYEELYSTVFKAYTSNIFSKIPYDVLFPE